MSETLKDTLKREIDRKTSRKSEYLSLANRLEKLGKFSASAKLRKISAEEGQHVETFEKILREVKS